MERYFYKLEKITHRPAEEDKITVVEEIREADLQLARILASKCYSEAVQDLHRKYSPSGFSTYDTRKGLGYNYQLLLIDDEEKEVYVVESSMQKIEAAVTDQKEEEKEIFLSLGLQYSEIEF